ncbi:MAG TPA: hypothetical protein VMW72_06520 [Sedimentisphaerales bacterium]|nr:hypothetical protein [Sedimentisphaerales bacterium]
MMKNKKFDCVRMKRDIQQQISKEFAGLPDEDTHKMQMSKVMKNPILGPFCKKVCSVKDASTK